MKKDIIYSIACLSFAIIIGGAVYEHLNVVPQWSAAPPVSLSMFQGEYGLKPDLFWKIIHHGNHPFIYCLTDHSLEIKQKETFVNSFYQLCSYSCDHLYLLCS